MKKKTIWIIVGAVVLIGLLIGLKKGGVIGGNDATKVAVESADNRTIIETVNASGKIYPEIEVKISSDVSGEITELNIEEGDSVKRGQVLARVFADIYNIQQQQAAAQVNQQQYQVANSQAQLAALKSTMEQTEAQYNRQRQLLEGKVISRQEFEVAENNYLTARANYNAALKGIDAARAGVSSARANLQRASKDLSRTTLTAPMDGVVSLLNVKQGERVVGTAQMAGTEMMRVADMSRMEVRVDVTENDIPKVHIGDSALVSVDAYLGRKFNGVVYQIASSNTGAATANVNAATTSTDVTNYKVYIRLLPESYADLIDPDRPKAFPFRPGMTASADIQTRVKRDILSVPINAVTTRDRDDKAVDTPTAEDRESETAQNSSIDEDKQIVVFVLDKATNKVKKVPVTTGIQDTRYIEILSGLTKGQEVVSEPYNVIFRTLKNDMEVQVVPRDKIFETD